MPDKRSHRGRHPEDATAFGPSMAERLRIAVDDLSWMLSRGYAEPSALKLVGDRYGLLERQRRAVMRCACTEAARIDRSARQISFADAAGRELWVDGYNVLTTIEAALAGGVIIAGRDGCYRDMASMHGTFRRVNETVPAIQLIGECLSQLGSGPVSWYLDRPVSNSGRLKATLAEIAAQRGWPWQVQVVPDPDAVLSSSAATVATADSLVLDRCGSWLNLARYVVDVRVGEAWLLDLAKLKGTIQ